MKPFKPTWFPSPISLPEKKSGKFEILHRILTDKTPLIGMRQAFMRGTRPIMCNIETPLRIHELKENGNVWMTDLPEELNQIAQMLHEVKPKGRVLIGGLGLGICAKMVAALPEVTTVDIVELNEDVINLAFKNFDLAIEKKMCCTKDDILRYIREVGPEYDYYLLDTWAGTGESTWWEDVMPLRRTIRNRFFTRPKIHCWAEDIMTGQITQAIGMGQRNWKYKGLPEYMTQREIKEFVTDVGLLSWEAKYGKLYPKEER